MRLSTEQKGFIIDSLITLRKLQEDIPQDAEHDHPLHQCVVLNTKMISKLCDAIMGNLEQSSQPIIEQFVFQPEILMDISMDDNFDEVAFVDTLEDLYNYNEF